MELAEQGALFELAYAPTATTGPSHATIFTSLYPIAHRVVKNGLTLGEEFQTLAEILRSLGYQTAAIVSSFVLDSKFGYAQGFEQYEDDFEATTSTIHVPVWKGHRVNGAFDRRADITTERAIAWLKEGRGKDRPFFLFVHYFDPHHPYVPPEPFRSIFAPSGPQGGRLASKIGAYDGEIAFTDHELGRLLDALLQLGLQEDTLVVITADHGEGLMQHGRLNHGVNIYEEAVRVPLLFRWPGRILSGKRFEAPVELVDLVPTILDLFGVGKIPGAFHGRSLAGTLEDDVPLPPDRDIYLYRRPYRGGYIGRIPVRGEKFGIRKGVWKYIEGTEDGSKELFNLERDPGERSNLYEPDSAKASELATRIDAWRRTHERNDVISPEVTDADKERLKALGYVE